MAVNMKGLLVAILLVIIAFIVIFNFVGTSSTELTTAAESITDANNCSESTTHDSTGAALTYNQTSKYCINSTGNDVFLAKQYDLPLNSLFGASGVALLVLMASILIFLIVLALKSFKGKQ